MRYTVREIERNVCKLRLKTDIDMYLIFYLRRQSKQMDLCVKKFEISHIVQNLTRIKEVWKTPGSAVEREKGSWYKLPRPGDPERGPAPH